MSNWARWAAAVAVVSAASLVAIYRMFPPTTEERVQEILESLENVQLSVHERLCLIEELQSFDLSHNLARTLLRKCTGPATHPEVQSTLMAVLCTFSEKEYNANVLLAANALDHLLSVLESDVALQATYLSSATAIFDLVQGNPAAKARIIEAGVARAIHRRLSSRAHSELTELLLTLSVRLLISYEANIQFIRAGVLGDVVRVFHKTKRRPVKERCINLLGIMTTFLTAERERLPTIPAVFAKYRIEPEIILIIHFDDPINTPWCLLILKNLLLLDLIRLTNTEYPSLFSDLLRLTGLNDDLRVIAGHTLILLLHHDPSFGDALTPAIPELVRRVVTGVDRVFLELIMFGLEHQAEALVLQYPEELRRLADYCAVSDPELAQFGAKIDAALDFRPNWDAPAPAVDLPVDQPAYVQRTASPRPLLAPKSPFGLGPDADDHWVARAAES
ncbi:hypothetical protein H9P43_010134 [Blastocladiella emersonii ATCC 22665]|nr:hypothetical protein H9P43_010134 [Blastocladiella emersonii ATCC 22665]